MHTLAAGARPANPVRNPDMQAWNAALAAYLAAKAAEDAYNRESYMPAFQRWSAAVDQYGRDNVPAGALIPEEIEAEIERLQNLRHDAEAALMAIPSPDTTAFARKFLVARGDGRAADGWDSLLEAEAKRFVGEA